MPEKVLVVPCMTSGQCCVFNAPQALALEIKKSLPWADGHQLHFMMHLSFCGWGVLISAGSREMSQNTWFLNVGKETGRERKTARLKNNLYTKMWKSTAFTVRVWLHTDWHISPWGHTSAVFIPRHQCLGENDSLTVRSGRWLCTLHIRETEKGHMWFDWNGQKKKPPSVTSLSRGVSARHWRRWLSLLETISELSPPPYIQTRI